METKKILITGLGAGATEAGIQTWLNCFGPVMKIRFICKGVHADSTALVETDISDEAAAYLVSRLSNYWHDGAVVNASLLHLRSGIE